MRYLLHFGIFGLALATVAQADAQGERRRGDRHTTVVIAAERGPRVVRPVRVGVEPHRAIYDSRRTVQRPVRPTYDARRAYFAQREDLEQIVRIADRWERATANRDRDAQSKVDRRLDAWLEREIRESIREPQNHRYTQRVRLLSRELAMLERRTPRGHGHYGHGNSGRGHGKYGQGKHGRDYHGEKGRIFNELVALSERQVRHAQAGVRYPLELSLARR